MTTFVPTVKSSCSYLKSIHHVPSQYIPLEDWISGVHKDSQGFNMIKTLPVKKPQQIVLSIPAIYYFCVIGWPFSLNISSMMCSKHSSYFSVLISFRGYDDDLVLKCKTFWNNDFSWELGLIIINIIYAIFWWHNLGLLPYMKLFGLVLSCPELIYLTGPISI